MQIPSIDFFKLYALLKNAGFRQKIAVRFGEKPAGTIPIFAIRSVNIDG